MADRSTKDQFNISNGMKREKEIDALGYDFTPDERTEVRNVFSARDEKLKQIDIEYGKNDEKQYRFKVNQAYEKAREEEAPAPGHGIADGPRPPIGFLRPTRNAKTRARAREIVAKNYAAEKLEIRKEATQKIQPILNKAEQEGRRQDNGHDPNTNNQKPSHDH